ncbi:MAG: phosphoglucosamine mutase [Bacteroidetes bacterium]|nr:MAG: phosphoglucosamine mutase [Bacteroidota bacterium]
MTLIKSISGIRGTIGGEPGDTLSPLDVVKFVSAYSTQLRNKFKNKKIKVVLGRDARISGPMVNHVVIGTLNAMGIDVIDLGLSTTPTVEMSVIDHKAQGGVILTASHNPKQWNALKLLNENGEFINASEGAELLEIAAKEQFDYAQVDDLGNTTYDTNAIANHIKHILNLDLVDVEAIRKANFTVALDAVNSTGGISILPLLKELGVENTVELYVEPTGHFPHNPEPLPEHLTELSAAVVDNKADVGFVVDPDVDRLAIVMENGEMFNEEYTLVAVADYILQHQPGNTVSNMSSTRALSEITKKQGHSYSASAVGEVNVVEMMRKTNAIIGGEGNGGIIYPTLHAGRDSLVGIALFLTYLAKRDIKVSELRAEYPAFFISKNKIQLKPEMDVDTILIKMEEKYSNENVSAIDGVKIDFANSWVHLRKSNTEPIIRIYAEDSSLEKADDLANIIINDIKSFM